MGNTVKMGKKENGGILRTQSAGSAAVEKSASAAEKVAGEEKRWEWGRFLLGSVRIGRDNRVG